MSEELKKTDHITQESILRSRLEKGERGIPKIPDSPDTRHVQAQPPRKCICGHFEGNHNSIGGMCLICHCEKFQGPAEQPAPPRPVVAGEQAVEVLSDGSLVPCNLPNTTTVIRDATGEAAEPSVEARRKAEDVVSDMLIAQAVAKASPNGCGLKAMEQVIASELAAAKREGLEEAARLVCKHCKSLVAKPDESIWGHWLHGLNTANAVPCKAADIWAAIAHKEQS